MIRSAFQSSQTICLSAAAMRARAAEYRLITSIAMTAHAMQRDRERCLAAGMG